MSVRRKYPKEKAVPSSISAGLNAITVIDSYTLPLQGDVISNGSSRVYSRYSGQWKRIVSSVSDRRRAS